jgi:hypothetical protein
MYTTEKYNKVVWDGAKNGWYEVWYFKLNDLSRKAAFWIRYTLLIPYGGRGGPVGEVWGIFFDKADPSQNRAFKETHPLDAVSLSRERFIVEVAGSALRHDMARGRVGDPGPEGMSWDLTIKPSDRPYIHMPDVVYKLPLPRSKGVAPNLSCSFSGSVNVNGRTFNLEAVPGHQSHHWGTKHMWKWAWANCNCFKERDDAVLEAVTGTYNEIGLETPHFSTLLLRVGGKDHHFHWVRNMFGMKSRFDERGWNLAVRNRTHEMRFAVAGDPEDMVCLTYVDPDLERKYCHNTSVADIRLELLERTAGGRGRPALQLTSDGGCAYELARPNPIPGVRLMV